MSYAATIQSVLDADSTFTALITGGVLTYENLPVKGINRRDMPGSYDSNGLLKPLCVVKLRSTIPDGALFDNVTQMRSVRRVIELWFYAARSAGWSDLENAADRARVLLDFQKHGSVAHIRYIGGFPNTRAEEPADACMKREDYEVYALVSA